MEQTTTACFVALIGMCVAADALVGAPGDCLRQPDFSPGAWRTSAVTPGRLEALVAAMRQQLVARGRQDAPSQRARIGEETGRLWICLAARLAETGADPRGAARYVNLTRLAAESACLNAIRLVPLRRAGDALREKEQLPLADIDAIAPGIELIRAPHPDDESLGCGGFIATVRARPPLVIVVTDGTGSHPGSRAYPPERLRAVREAEVPAAVAILGLPPASVRFLRLQDTRAPHAGLDFDRAVHRVAALAREHGVARSAPPGDTIRIASTPPRTGSARPLPTSPGISRASGAPSRPTRRRVRT